jgi:serine/threonine protein kinase
MSHGAEYGAGNMVSTHGDVYSYGILVLELVTGKRPTDGSSTQGLSLREYVELGLHGSGSRVLDVVDTQLSLGRVDELQTDCVVSLLRLGVSCSHEMPSSRMATGDVVRELRGINESLVQGLAS